MDREPKIILASASPRRAELLAMFGKPFVVEPSNIDESTRSGETPTDYIIRLALSKVREVGARVADGLIIGADTIVLFEGEILGKPQDEEEAFRMLKALSGRWHSVMTAVALYVAHTKQEVVGYEKTMVRFSKIKEPEIRWYLATGEYKDKAGAYGIQGYAGLFIKEIAGNYHNVVGFPLSLVYQLAKHLGYQWLSSDT